jgi:glycosyltransferase involved in cell wall biosynthesis
MRLPVIVTDTGGSHEIVQDGISGIVIPGGNAHALATAAVRLSRDSRLRNRLTAGAGAFVDAHLTARRTARALGEVYNTLLTKHRFTTHNNVR